MELTATKYKQTEVGLIPEDWNVKSLGDIGEVKMCKRIFNYQTKDNGDIPFYKIGTFGKEPDAFISREIYNEFRNKYSFPTVGSVLISAAGTIGRLVVFDGTDSYFQDSNIIWIENNNQVISNEYLRHSFPNVRFQTEGGTIKRLYNNILKSGLFPCPPNEVEQKVISRVLSDTDALIQALEKKIAKKKHIKKGVMQKLLTPKENWIESKVSSVGQPYGGMSGKTKSDFSNGNAHYVPFMNVMSNPITDTGYLDSVNIKKGETQNKILKGDLLFNGSSETPEEVGFCSALLEQIDDLYLNSFCFGFRIHNTKKYDSLFLAYFFRSTLGRKFFYSLAQGATRYNLSKTNFLKSTLTLPIHEDQVQIASIIRDMDSEIENLEQKLSKYQLAKQGMMQQLLTGKIRLV